MKLEEIESYINEINIKDLSMEDLEHYVRILIEIENVKIDNMLKKRFKDFIAQ